MADASHSGDEFYVGYLPAAPKGLARFVRGRVVLLFAVVAAVAALVVTAQDPFARADFEFGTLRSFEGVLREQPYPTLEVERPGGGVSSFLLVAQGKFGAETLADVQGADGRRAKIDGTLIHRDTETMLEIAAVQLLPGDPVPAQLATVSLGMGRFYGEIVDSKCYLGVMKPGDSKIHRACATRCISGGIPPVLRTRDAVGPTAYLLLTDVDGSPVNDRVLDIVAEPISVQGELFRTGDRLVLAADPATYERWE